MKELTATEVSDREIISARLLNFPRNRVFEAWTDPKHLATWWGPKDFKNTFHEFDLRVGGQWLFTMHGPSGADYPNKVVFQEINEPESIVLQHESEPRFQVTATFEEKGEKTQLTFRMLFESAKVCSKVKVYAVPANEENFDRLEAVLSQMKDAEFLFLRDFDAPKDLVFRSFTEAERLAKWWGPEGFTLGVKKMDLRSGGDFHYSMTSADGFEMWGKFDYFDVSAPDRIVFTNSFSDADGNITRAPFSASWPLKILNLWTFTEKDGKTTLMLRGSAYDATAEEQNTFKQGFESMRQGFGGTFNQLELYLSTLK